ncbi:MAG TPA: class I SAM-dependent methyltransferase [Steroidobacteraceae bacterium]|nr:class I SAM-dependent methyltransferase [Steroidobacteraceae bacterium]
MSQDSARGASPGPGNPAARAHARSLIDDGSAPSSPAAQAAGNPRPSEGRLSCKACGSGDIQIFYRVRDVPAHSCLMLSSRDEALAFPRGEIELGFCRGCGFIGNTKFDPGLNRYSAAYEETQAYSPRFLRFLDEIWEEQVERFGLGPGMTALEIGCGKGEFLVGLCERSGCAGIGLDPAYRPERTRSSAAERITFIRDFYGPKYSHLQADYVGCRHTLEHIAPVLDFVRLVRETIGERRHVNVFFELPDMERVLQQGAFWDIYYEHCSYFTRGSLARVFRAACFDVRRLYKAYDDQYLMLEAEPAAAPTDPLLPQENDLAAMTALVARFERQVNDRLQSLSETVARHRARGDRLAIWGSGSKCVSLVSSLHLGPELVAVVDINPHKHGKFLAGSGLRIVGPDTLGKLRPDVVLVMNSIYCEEIRHELAARGLEPHIIPL